MTEGEWLTCTDPMPMLEYEKQRPSGSGRKQRLFACACCRQVDDLFEDARCLEAVQVGEQFAEGSADADDVVAAFEVTYELVEEQRNTQGDATVIADLANLTCQESSEIACYAYQYLLDLTVEDIRPVRQVWGLHVVRCIFGNPFRPISVNSAWQTPTVTAVATAAYEERELPAGTLNADRLAVLADALEDAGCDNADILAHCRGSGPHVRGCWVVDLLLGKEGQSLPE
jgi:hypothetical protein